VSHAVIVLLVFGLSAGSSAFFVRRTIDLSHRLGIVDRPGARSARNRVVPRMGGVAILLAFLLGVGATFSMDVERFAIETERMLLLVLAVVVLAIVMVYDDALDVRAWSKLLWQAGAAALVVLPRLRGPSHGIVIDRVNVPFVGSVDVPVFLAMAGTIIWLVGFANALNFVDGLDGLAGSLTVVACAVLFAHTYFRPSHDPQFTISLLPVALGAAVIGFLPFNWHPGKIIMGDAGAQFLGFALAAISIIGGAKIATALLALGLPALDLIWVIAFRATHGSSPMRADRRHLHHRLIDLGWSHQQVVYFMAGTSGLFGISAIILPSQGSKLLALVLIAMLLLLTLAATARAGRRRTERSPLS